MPAKVIDYDTLDSAAAVIAPDETIFMFNLMRFKPQATYLTTDPKFATLATCTGQEAYYTRYIPKFFEFKPVMTPVFIGRPIQGVLASEWGSDQIRNAGRSEGVVGDGHHGGGKKEEWDNVSIIRYKNLAEFRKLIDNDVYRETAMPHRIAAIEEYKLVVCTEMSIPGGK